MVLLGRLALLSLVLSLCQLVDELASDDPRVLNNFRLPTILLLIYLLIILLIWLIWIVFNNHLYVGVFMYQSLKDCYNDLLV